MKQRTIVENVTAIRASLIPSSLPSFCNVSMNVGTNAADRAPSANSRRRRFGIRNATKKESEPTPAPRRIAIIRSRMNPEIRLRLVQKPTTPAAFVISFFSEFTEWSVLVGNKRNNSSSKRNVRNKIQMTRKIMSLADTMNSTSAPTGKGMFGNSCP